MGNDTKAFVVARVELAFKNITDALRRADLDAAAFKSDAVSADVAEELMHESHSLVESVA